MAGLGIVSAGVSSGVVKVSYSVMRWAGWVKNIASVYSIEETIRRGYTK